MIDKHIIDVGPLKSKGWSLVRHGVSNCLLSTMSLADVPPIKIEDIIPHGKWIETSMTVYDMEKILDSNFGIDEDILNNILVYHCSNCGISGARTNYCPNCGAKMSLENEDEDEEGD